MPARVSQGASARLVFGEAPAETRSESFVPGAAHTPIMFAKGGGNAMFSAECVQMLSDAGFTPDDFGTYNQLSEQVKPERRQAKRMVALLERKRERQGGELSPRDEDRLQEAQRAASVEVAHLGQNATRQGQRGRVCSNVVDGHSDGDYPCVLLGGPAMVNGEPNPDSEHGRQTQQEFDHADRAAANATATTAQGDPVYPAEQLRADERARASAIVRDRASTTQTSSAQDAGAMPETPSPQQTASLAAYEAALRERKTEGEHEASVIDGQTAAECIDTYQKMGEAAMKRKMEERTKQNAETAGSAKDRADARADADAAEAHIDAANGGVREARREFRNAMRSSRNLNRPDNPRRDPTHRGHAQWQADRAAASQRVREADGSLRRAQRVQRGAVREARRLRTNASKMEAANCRAEQGRRLAAGQGRTDGRVPGNGAPDRSMTDHVDLGDDD